MIYPVAGRRRDLDIGLHGVDDGRLMLGRGAVKDVASSGRARAAALARAGEFLPTWQEVAQPPASCRVEFGE